MYFLHLFTSTVFQNCLVPIVSSDLVVGLTSLLMNSCQRFSIGFRSGDSGDVFTN